ncbi:MAG: hypothetical protein IT462_15530 [Planctomycetes bacterium]|nr:hypothetical protein [Planctomycetota bacterium]
MRKSLNWLPFAACIGFAAALIVFAAPVVRGETVDLFEDASDEVEDRPVDGKDAGRVADKSVDRISRAPKAALRLYEWGVQRQNWDGSAIKPNDVPEFYYSAAEVPLGTAPERPEPQPEPEPEPEPEPPCVDKPVVYFEADDDMSFWFEVKMLVGDITWMYPKPDRRVDAATAQWDEIKLCVGAHDAKRGMPALHGVARDHWANFSREGGISTIVVNGEAERFLFYEGTNRDLPEADVSRDAEGNVVIRNYGCAPLHDVRLRLPLKEGSNTWRAWYVREIPAASGDRPAEVKLVDGSLVNLEDIRKPGVLTAETKAAGLTDAQARVFERCWKDEFFAADAGVLTFRRDPKYLDEMAKLGLPANIKSESHRVGYQWISNIDLSRQGEMDKLAVSVAEGDKDAQGKLAKLGVAGVGAVRRLMGDSNLSLKKRLALASWLKDQVK